MNFHYETTVFGLDDEGNQYLNSSYTANYLVSESESEIESEKKERERERERDRKKRRWIARSRRIWIMEDLTPELERTIRIMM